MSDYILFWVKHNALPIFSDNDWDEYFELEKRLEDYRKNQLLVICQRATMRLLGMRIR